ncbi:MAG TPA: EAL domain-containing protein [Gammaproteobacteria bacterium]|nr:EAL domain-containing protein [Gammaproteobacteria bacterium]
MHSLQFKLFALVFGLLLLIQSTSLFLLYRKMQAQAVQTINAQLDAGQHVFEDQFESRRKTLSIYAQTLAKDFGLLEAFHEGGRSLLRALDKRRQRVGADIAVAVDTGGRIRADTARPGFDGRQFELAADAMPYATRHTVFLEINDITYQLAAAPLRAPNQVGWVLLGFQVDTALAQRFAALTSLNVTFFVQQPNTNHWQLLATTLPVHTLTGLVHGAAAADDPPFSGRAVLGHDTYVGKELELGGAPGRQVTALLQGSESAALANFRPWWWQIVNVLGGALLLSLLGAWLLARSVTKPVRLLLQQAGAIEAGNYTEPLTVHERGELGELVEKFNRMQDAIARREASIRHHARHDALTGLPNRNRLEQLVTEQLEQRQSSKQRLVVMVIGLDRFKDINDTLGYEAGDQLLCEVAQRLREMAGAENVVARIGGDEFGVMLCHVNLRSIPDQIARFASAFERPFLADGLTLHLSARLGLASHPDHGHDAATLLRHADMAKWSAKQQRRAFAIFDGSQDPFSRLRLSLLGELQQAIAQGDLLLQYQPKVALSRDALNGAEALVRWQHPVYGIVPPEEFIPMLEHTGNITLVTAWALHAACVQAMAWQRAEMPMRIAVNTSAYDLRNTQFVESVEQMLRDTAIDPALIGLEITESAVMEDVDQAVTAFEHFRGLGLTLSIDDYGTGYSSMAQLKRLPLDELKIDRSFVMGLDRNDDDETIVRSTIELGHNMGLKVVGEGVESRAGLNVLRKLRCDVAQGYFISHALAAEEFAAWWQASHWRNSAMARA